MRDDLLLVLAENDQGYVAGALNFIGRDALYGRYWGCVEDHPCHILNYAIIRPSISRLNMAFRGSRQAHKANTNWHVDTCHPQHIRYIG